MNRPVRTTTPGGEDIVILPARQFERLLEAAEDARDVAIAEKVLADFEAHGGDVLTDADLRALLRAPHPLAFWRRRRGLAQSHLAKTVGVSPAYLARIEKGKRVGDIDLHGRLATALGLDIEDLLPPSKPGKKRRSR